MTDQQQLKKLDEQINALENALKTIELQEKFIEKLIGIINKQQNIPAYIPYPIYPNNYPPLPYQFTC